MPDAKGRGVRREGARCTPRRGTVRRTRWAAAAVLPALVLTACGEDEVGAKPELPTEPPALWNPCDALDASFVEKHFGATTTEHDGTPQAPECRFAPAKESGQPVVTANYQLFRGSLEEFWHAMGQAPDADVRTPTIKGADAARIVVAVEKKQLYVTGFVQNGDLYEVVNVVDPAPYDEARVVRATEATLARLSAHADAARAGEQTPSAG
ncbi:MULTISPECIES: hypothetical protein [Nocardioides]|uniref:DUF3558 domain-containing protein n=1 Tax=Nocardioides vastitatis TaxID=2568655 RepID=A0ABW0ZGL1_9ACTN|nr:hypothetical protein [Nocardioides sp.]THJ08259.1 hypothetical protein E7Z54_04765 [Nocardioides sp.]